MRPRFPVPVGPPDRRQLPSISSARAPADVRAREAARRTAEEEALDKRYPQDKRANSSRVSLEELFFLRPSRHVPSLRCPAVPRERTNERGREKKKEGRTTIGRKREKEVSQEEGEEVEK